MGEEIRLDSRDDSGSLDLGRVCTTKTALGQGTHLSWVHTVKERIYPLAFLLILIYYTFKLQFPKILTDRFVQLVVG